MRKKVILVVLIVFWHSAYAENEFTFNVPVTIENIDYDGGAVVCWLHSEERGYFDYGHVSFNAPSNSEQPYSNTFEVVVSSASPRLANEYQCYLELYLGSSRAITGSFEEPESFDQQFQDRTGLELVSSTTLVGGVIE